MTKEIVFVTSNQGKIASAQKYLKNIKLISYNAELVEPRSDDIREIASKKVQQAYKLVKKPCIALDAGFFIKAYNGFPRAYVNHMLDTLGVDGVLKLMDGVLDRRCEFRSCLAFFDGKKEELFEDISRGVLSEGIFQCESSKKWSELWNIFIPQGFDKTLSQFEEDDFSKYDKLKEPSAIKKFGEWYSSSYEISKYKQVYNLSKSILDKLNDYKFKSINL